MFLSQKNSPVKRIREIKKTHENDKKDSNSSQFSTPCKESDSEPMKNILKRQKNREIYRNDEIVKEDSKSSQFSTPSKESDSETTTKRYENREISDFSQFSTPCKESDSKFMTKKHGKNEINGKKDLKSSLFSNPRKESRGRYFFKNSEPFSQDHKTFSPQFYAANYV